MLIISYIISCLLIVMLVEYFSHKYLMHKRLFPFIGPLDKVFIRHSLLHHKDERNDTNIDLEWWFALLMSLPIVIAFYLVIGWIPALVMLLTSIVYAIVWTKMHRAFHDLENSWIKYIPGYKLALKHHLDHHNQPNRNLGTVFWFSDYVFGTKV